jgi:excisionase family DNA binding protein
LLGVSKRTLYRALESGTLPSIAIGRRRLIPRAALERFLADPPKHNGAGANSACADAPAEVGR